MHDVVPQLLMLVLLRHMFPLHLWKPVLHVNPQDVPSQVAFAFAGGVQTMQEEPQVLMSVASEHVPLQLL